MRSALAFSLGSVAAAAAAGSPVDASNCVSDPGSLVDTFIGTAADGYGSGGHFPGASAPFSAMRVSPDTMSYYKGHPAALPWATGGYRFQDSHITAFSHTHMVGAGVLDLGNVGVMPLNASFSDECLSGYSGQATNCLVGFDHANEESYAGYYDVKLDSGVEVELTASSWAATHRWTFPSDEGHFFLDLGHSLAEDATGDASLQYSVEDNVLQAYVHGQGGYVNRVGGTHIYVAADLPAAPSSYGSWLNGTVTAGQAAAGNGSTAGFYASFPVTAGEPVELRLGMSFVSAERALANLRNAQPTFDAMLEETKGQWQEQLSVLDICDADADADSVVEAYTALYHATLAPTRWSEDDGGYIGFDKEFHQDKRPFYTEMSIWDIHRTQSPLMTLVDPEGHQADILQSLVTMYEQGNGLSKWPMNNGDTGGMIGTHADVMLGDAIAKGVTGFDTEKALDIMIESAFATDWAFGMRTDPASYAELGYVDSALDERSASKSLAYAFDDAAIASAACALRGPQDGNCTLFTERAGWWANSFETEDRKIPCPRDVNGTFSCASKFNEINPFDPHFAEGDAAQYRWFVMGRPEEVADKVFGGERAMARSLNEYFELSQVYDGNFLPNYYYWHGNEPCLGNVWMFNFAGRPDLAQKWSREIIDTKYGTDAWGLAGNDDYGTLSSWLIFAQAGFYPLAGTGDYVIGSPMFANMTIGAVSVEAHDASAENIYVQRVELNGEPLEGVRFSHADLVGASGTGKLEFWMGASPP